MVNVKPGTRFKSAVCDTEFMVVKGTGDIDLRCGGSTVLASGETGGGELSEGYSDGCLIGKRYVDQEASVELLCTKGGAGSLSVGDQILTIKQAEALPSSD